MLWVKHNLQVQNLKIEIKNPIVPPIADDSIPPRAVIIKSRFLWPLTLPLLISTSYFFAHSLISGIFNKASSVHSSPFKAFLLT